MCVIYFGQQHYLEISYCYWYTLIIWTDTIKAENYVKIEVRGIEWMSQQTLSIAEILHVLPYYPVLDIACGLGKIMLRVIHMKHPKFKIAKLQKHILFENYIFLK